MLETLLPTLLETWLILYHEDWAPPFPPSGLGTYHRGLYVMGTSCLHSRGTESGGLEASAEFGV